MNDPEKLCRLPYSSPSKRWLTDFPSSKADRETWSFHVIVFENRNKDPILQTKGKTKSDFRFSSYFEWRRRFRWNRGNENDFRGETNYTRGRFNRVDRDEWKRETRENGNILITRWRCNKARPTRARKFRRGEASRVASLEKRDGGKKRKDEWRE